MPNLEVDTGSLSLYPMLGMGISLKVYLNIIEMYTETFQRILNRRKIRPDTAHDILYKTYIETIDILDDDMYSETSILSNICDFYDSYVESFLSKSQFEVWTGGIVKDSYAPDNLVRITEDLETDMCSIYSVLEHIVSYDFEYSSAQYVEANLFDSAMGPMVYHVYANPLDYESDKIDLNDGDRLKDIDVYMKRLTAQCEILGMIRTISEKFIHE